jgi:hypothetical protein
MGLWGRVITQAYWLLQDREYLNLISEMGFLSHSMMKNKKLSNQKLRKKRINISIQGKQEELKKICCRHKIILHRKLHRKIIITEKEEYIRIPPNYNEYHFYLLYNIKIFH